LSNSTFEIESPVLCNVECQDKEGISTWKANKQQPQYKTCSSDRRKCDSFDF